MSNEISAAIAERAGNYDISEFLQGMRDAKGGVTPVSYTHLRAHETN